MRVLIASVLSFMAMASIAPQQPDVTRIGPAVGTPAPGFELTGQDGRTHTLDSVAGPHGTMLVFFRSADW